MKQKKRLDTCVWQKSIYINPSGNNAIQSTNRVSVKPLRIRPSTKATRKREEEGNSGSAITRCGRSLEVEYWTYSLG